MHKERHPQLTIFLKPFKAVVQTTGFKNYFYLFGNFLKAETHG